VTYRLGNEKFFLQCIAGGGNGYTLHKYTIGCGNGYTLQSSDQAHLFDIGTIGAIDRTSGQPQVKLSQLRRISLKIRQLEGMKDAGTKMLNKENTCKFPLG
jgi:hypothetical protein